MDSGNSGSMQSSSCGDEIEEYDSRAESSNFSAFLNNPPPTIPQREERNNHVITSQFGNNNSNNNLNPQTQHHHHHNQMFDPLPNYYMDPLHKQSTPSSNPNSFLNLDMIWSKATARSEPNNNTDLSSLLVPSSTSSSSSQQNQQAFLLSQFVGQRENVASVPTTHQQHHQYHQQQQHHSLPLESTSRGGSLTNDHQDLMNSSNNNSNNVHQPGRNPKKRSRASRRAPTTVLTTDTTNFRAMVQEFTGIPAPPFSSPFPRTRLDLFGSSVASRSMSNHMDPPPPPPPPYLLRPFAQKIQPFSPLIQSSSSSMMENLASTNSASINYHLSQQNNHPLMQHNQILGFQSISQTPTKYPHGTQQPSLETTPNVDSRIKMSTVFDELGLSHTHGHVNNTNNVNIGLLHHQNNNNMVTNTTTSSEAVNNNNENQWSQRTNDFGAEKVQECVVVSTRGGEGTTVESWINCSSSE
ncbi:uncharacterized protein LOC131661442 [Vicia villosa]|uniref:uncharacterized protein LOC131661442 n=1 Tax=Vicia villosa TaxID=3911 RepID=UPI00273C2393|nr:uncharacterized protein LOC131661442 [Vicia villosa]